MLSFFQTSFTGATANRAFLEVTSNNLANLNTTAFRASRTEFADRLYQELSAENVGLPPESRFILPEVGTGAAVSATSIDTHAGNLVLTGDPLHVAIVGKGFFPVLQPDGSAAYTRDGGFTVDSNRNLVHSSGYLVQPPINIPADVTAVSIDETGVVQVIVPDPNDPLQKVQQVIGTLQLALFPNEKGLDAIGSNLFVESAASGQAALVSPGSPDAGKVQSGAIESSNVDLPTEMTNIILAQRAYQMNMSALRQMDEMLALATRLRR